MTKLYVLTIALHRRASDIELVYNDEARAKEAHKAALSMSRIAHPTEGITAIVDDYGRSLSLKPDSIELIMLRDLAEELNGRSAINILEQHANIDHARRSQQDQKIAGARTIMQMAQGGGPMPPGIMRGN